MKVEFLNPFIVAASRVLEAEAQAQVQKGQPRWHEGYFTLRDITVSISVVGSVEGTVLYGMDESTAKAIVGAIVGSPIPIFDRLAESGIAELGNVITGMASAGLEAAGYPCNISPPSVISGRGTILSMVNIQSVVLPLETRFGNIDVHLALREKPKK